MLTKTERKLFKNQIDFHLKRCYAFAKEKGFSLRLYESPSSTHLSVASFEGKDEYDFRLLLQRLAVFEGAFGVYQAFVDVRYSDFVRSFCREFHYTLEEVCNVNA